MKYNTVIFDFDGTLADTQEAIAKGFQLALAAYGIQEDLHTITGLIGPPLSRTIITRYGLSEDDGAEAMAIFRNYQQEVGLHVCRAFEGVPEMLTALAGLGLKLGIATNKPESSALPQIEAMGLGRYFSSIVANNDKQDKGSKADFIRMALEECGAAPSRAVMVGDRSNDIQGGKDNGLDTIAVLYGYGSREELEGCNPTHIAATPLELVALIQGSAED